MGPRQEWRWRRVAGGGCRLGLGEGSWRGRRLTSQRRIRTGASWHHESAAAAAVAGTPAERCSKVPVSGARRREDGGGGDGGRGGVVIAPDHPSCSLSIHLCFITRLTKWVQRTQLPSVISRDLLHLQ